MTFRPLLAYRENPPLNAISYPKLLSPKYDGIRAVRPIGDIRLHTRKLKLVPNINVRERFCHVTLDGLDGELIIGEPWNPTCYHKTESVVMSYAPPKPATDVRLFVFDSFSHPEYSYQKRLDILHGLRLPENVIIVEQKLAWGPMDVLEYENEMVELGYEGIMLRDPLGVYKNGRSTLREEYLMKLKRFEDSEAIIESVYEQMENTNEAKESELGYMKRSKKQAGMLGKGTFGGVEAYDPVKKWHFRCGMGPGLTDEVRAELWARRKTLPKLRFKYRFQPAGTKDKPRSPRWMGLRDRKDA